MPNKTRRRFVGGDMRTLVSCVATVALSGMAWAGPRDFVVEHAGVGATTQQAEPYIQQFLKFTEEKLSWKDLKGQFFAEPDEAFKKYIETEKPGFAMIDPDQFLELAKKEQLTLLATVEGKNQSLGHLHLVAKDPKLTTLESTKGKSVASTHLQSPKFLSKVVFDGKIDVAQHFSKLDPKGSSLKAAKAVNNAEADLALFSDEEMTWLKGSPYSELKEVWVSGPLPPMSVSAFGKTSKPADRQAFAKMLLGMCSDPKGAEVCKAMDITKFGPPDKASYDAAMKKFGGAAAKGRKAPRQ
jgi:ABC-type phosphate/phosphonate transport system substrate-binding protein